MRVAILLSIVLLGPATAGCIVPKDMPALREKLGYASVDRPDFAVHARAPTLTPAVNQAITLTAEVQGLSQDDVEVTWTVEGEERLGPNTTVTFATPGPKPVNVTAEGPNGTAATDQITLEVRDNRAPEPTITIEQRKQLTAGEPVTLSANASLDPDDDALSYEWILDGERVDETAWFETTLEPGPHVVELTVDDGLESTSAVEAFAVDEEIRETRNLTAQDNVTQLNLQVREGLETLALELTHTTRLGADDVRLIVQGPDGERIADADTAPEPGASNARETIELDGSGTAAGPYTVTARLEQGVSSTVTIEGVLAYTPLPANPG